MHTHVCVACAEIVTRSDAHAWVCFCKLHLGKHLQNNTITNNAFRKIATMEHAFRTTNCARVAHACHVHSGNELPTTHLGVVTFTNTYPEFDVLEYLREPIDAHALVSCEDLHLGN